MPYFVFYGIDKPGAEPTRLKVRPEHGEHLRRPIPGCRAVAGGPLMDDADEHMIGSLLVFEADDRAAVERFLAGDPYTREAIFERTEIRAWRWGLNPPGRGMAEAVTAPPHPPRSA
jgi:uncharacterized protein YciI